MGKSLIQAISYPGIRNGVNSFTYYCARGITPGRINIVTNPQAGGPPAESGDIVLSDGVNTIKLRDCRVDELLETWSPEGLIWTLTLSDRRWRWKTGTIRGRYNQYDKQNKLQPWSIRSLKELAELCFAEMGETGYQIFLPDGLTRKDGSDKKLDDILRLGQNFPQTATNPPVDWVGDLPPAVCLANFIEEFGAEIYYQPTTDRVVVSPYGGDFTLNETIPFLSSSKGLKNPKTPQAVVVYGAETAYQVRFQMEPVGLDYGSVWVPIDELSYAPVLEPSKLTVSITVTAPTARYHKAVISSPVLPNNGTAITILGTTLSDLAGKIALNADLNKLFTVTVGGSTLTMTQRVAQLKGGGPEWTVSSFEYTGVEGTDYPFGASGTIATNSLSRNNTTGRWRGCPPPLFAAVRATERLSFKEAQALARQSVWKAYRIKMLSLKNVPYRRGDATVPRNLAGFKPGAKKKANPQNGVVGNKYNGRGVEVPGYGVVQRRQQCGLLGRMVDQITPQPRNLGGLDRDPAIAGGVMPDFYSGFSRDADARAYAEFACFIGSVQWVPQSDSSINSKPNTRVRVPFSIIPDQQIMMFSDFVYRVVGEGNQASIADPNVIYEGAVIISDYETNQTQRFVKALPIRGGNGPAKYQRKEDVIVSWVGQYGDTAADFTKLKGEKEQDFGDGRKRADYYLKGMLRQYQSPRSQVILFCGTQMTDPDSAVSQVIWQFSPDGPRTTVSANSEVSEIVPQAAERRLSENLPPNIQAKLLNLSENFGSGAGGLLSKAGAIANAVGGPLGRLLGG